MRNTVLIILGSSSVVTPPNSLSNYSITTANSSTKPSKCCCTSTSNTSIPQTSSSSSSSSSYTPLLSTVRWDLTFRRHQNRLNYYARLASKLVRDGNLHDFLLIAETVLHSGVKPYQFMALLQSDVVSEGMVEMLESGEINKVLDALFAAHKLGFDVLQLFDAKLTEAFRTECRRREVEDVVDIFGILIGFNFSIKELVTPSEFIKLCVTKRKANAAVRYARYFPNAQILFCTIILEFGKKCDLVSALNTFEESKQDMDCPNMYIYRAVIDVCGLCGDFLRSRSIYEELQTQNITPNLYVFNSLMNVNSRDLSYTLQIYKNMQILGVAADMTSYNILLKSCCHASRVDLAQEIYREVQHLESTGVLKLDVFTYSTIVKVFADAKMWQMALEIKEDMLAAGVTPNTITWSSLINACASAGLVEQAILLFEEMLLAGCKPNTQCCNIVLHACVEACQYDRAFRLFEIWKGNTFKLSHRKDCQGNINLDGDRAYDSFRTNVPYSGSDSNHVHFTKSIPFTPTTATYNILMKACGTDHHRAKALMKEMKTLGLSPNHISWSIMIDIFGGSRNVRGAMQILNSMREAGIKPDVVAYTATIKVCVQNKHLKSAFSLFEQMKIYQIQPNLVTYNTLLRARSRYGSVREVQQCLAIYQDMRKAGYNSNDYYLKQLIEEWCEGIIQGNKLNQGKHSCSSRSDLGGPQSFLLEKVAANLQNTGAESYVVDLQGLTKVEARIVVLSVLQMIKEKYAPGNSVKDDMVIILGNQGVGSDAVSGKFDLKEAIIKLLCDDLGLQVVVADFEPAAGRNINAKNPSGSYPNSAETIISSLPALLDSPTRRPVDLVRLKVTKKSLQDWLQKRLRCS